MEGLPDTTDVKPSEFPPIEAKWYEMSFKDFEEKVDKNGNTYTQIELAFAESDRPAWTNLSHQEDFLWQAQSFKKAIGMADKDKDLTPFKDSRLMVFVKNRAYDGSNYPEPKKFKPMAGTSSSAPPDDGEPLPF